ncbi:MAG: hypothetical protein ACE5G8_17630, partial [Anaerolineae bacterium]
MLNIEKTSTGFKVTSSPPLPDGHEITVTTDGGQFVVLTTGGGMAQFSVADGELLLKVETIVSQPNGTYLIAINDDLQPIEKQRLLVTGNGYVKIEKEYEPTTAITLVSFTAAASGRDVTLTWQTGTEIDNAGFNLYRAASANGPWTKLNSALIAAQGDPVAGAGYT